MKNTKELMARLRCRLEQDRLTDAEFTIALAEILAASVEGLSGADHLILSQEIREVEKAWRINCERPAN